MYYIYLIDYVLEIKKKKEQFFWIYILLKYFKNKYNKFNIELIFFIVQYIIKFI